MAGKGGIEQKIAEIYRKMKRIRVRKGKGTPLGSDQLVLRPATEQRRDEALKEQPGKNPRYVKTRGGRRRGEAPGRRRKFTGSHSEDS